MKNKGILSLIELTVMLAVFALAAALCLQAFAQADRISKQAEATDKAVAWAQNAAEILQNAHGDTAALTAHYGGTATESGWQLALDQSWQPTTEAAAFYLTVTINGTQAQIRITESHATEELIALPVGWQEG